MRSRNSWADFETRCASRNYVRGDWGVISRLETVAPERGRAQAVTAKLNRPVRRAGSIETVLWEGALLQGRQTSSHRIPAPSLRHRAVDLLDPHRHELPQLPLMANGRPYPSGSL